MLPARIPWPWLRRLVLELRDALIVLAQFRGALLAFAAIVVAGGGAYYVLARQAGEARPASLAEAFFLSLSMIFLQANVDFPSVWQLQPFFFIMPLLGLGVLGQGVADIGVLLFNRRARGEAWQVAVAKTFSDHIVLVGLGHLGFRVARALHQLGEPFVCVELNPEAGLSGQVQDWEVPIIRGDALKPETLRRAGLERARTIVLATSDDVMNLQIAIHARSVNPRARTIVRLFDDDFARELVDTFGITSALSTSALAAPTFATAAAGLDVVQSVMLNDRVLNLSRFTVEAGSALAGQSVQQVEHHLNCSVVLLQRGAASDLHPADSRALQAGDQITVFADTATLHRLGRLAAAGS